MALLTKIDLHLHLRKALSQNEENSARMDERKSNELQHKVRMQNCQSFILMVGFDLAVNKGQLEGRELGI